MILVTFNTHDACVEMNDQSIGIKRFLFCCFRHLNTNKSDRAGLHFLGQISIFYRVVCEIV